MHLRSLFTGTFVEEKKWKFNIESEQNILEHKRISSEQGIANLSPHSLTNLYYCEFSLNIRDKVNKT